VYVSASAQGSMRIYAPQELARLSTECRGFLLFLEQAQVLNAETREICIERLLELDKPDIELDDLKWVVMMVLFNVPGSENAYQQMEELVFDESDGVIH
jgi:Smg protein